MNNKGQSLIELIVALGLLTVIVTILTLATINGLQNSQFSKNQAQATKLGQEALEKIRTMRERNYTVCGPNPTLPGGVTDWNSLFSSVMNCPQTPAEVSCKYILTTVQTAPTGCTPTEFWLNNISTPATQFEPIPYEGVVFSRLITIRDYGGVTAQKEVTVTVSWTDLSGTHSSKLVTVLARI